MEDFSTGAILSSLVAGLILAVLGIGLLTKRKQSMVIKKSTVKKDVNQEIDTSADQIDTEQSLKVVDSEIDGDLNQKTIDKKKQS
jgi:hypothetical protein